MKKRALVFLCVAFLSSFYPAAHTASRAALQNSPATQIQLEPVASALSRPVYVTTARDASNRLFILEQAGRVRVLPPGAATSTIFLDIASKVLSPDVGGGNEQGLLGITFHPQYSTNRRFFIDYTRRPDGATVIAEYHVSNGNPNLAEQTETVLLVIPQPFANHNGGMVEFGPDGYLYIGMGDGGSANDPGNRAQNTNELLGKILRIDVDHTSGSQGYSSPPDNPFFGSTPGRDEIFAYGLRNPWRFSFDRMTGELYAGDVGQGQREEIDIITRGGNYGWRVMEGARCTGNDASLCSGASPCNVNNYVCPLFEYSHSGGRCSLTGGYVYRGQQSSLPFGAYVYADFCTGEIFMLRNGVSSLLADTGLQISSFGEDEAGEIYVVGLGGTIDRIKGTGVPLPPFTISSAFVRHRSSGDLLQPVSVKSKSKKYEIVINVVGFPPELDEATVFVNGIALKTTYTQNTVGTAVFIARLKGTTLLAQPGVLVIEVIRPDGSRSNQIMIEVLPSSE